MVIASGTSMERARVAWAALMESPCRQCCAKSVIIFLLAVAYCGVWAGIFCLWYFTTDDGPWRSLLMSAWITPFVVVAVPLLLLVVCAFLSWCCATILDVCKTVRDSVVHVRSRLATFDTMGSPV